jgi:hypothetical protein
MRRIVRWFLAALGLTAASVAVFILALGLLPGDPMRFYLIFGLALLSATLLWRVYEAAALSRKLARIYEIRNDFCDELEVWIEPWCHPYRVPRGSVLKLSYNALPGVALHTEQMPDRLVVYTNSAYAPAAELDGRPVVPDFGWSGSRARS